MTVTTYVISTTDLGTMLFGAMYATLFMAIFLTAIETFARHNEEKEDD